MNRRLIQLLLCITLFVAVAVGEGPTRRPAPKKPADAEATAPERKQVCQLLTTGEIEGVQGERVEEAKPSSQPSGGLLMSQCLFRTPTQAKSVSLALAAPAAQKPRDYWRRHFHSGAEKAQKKGHSKGSDKAGKASARESEEEEESRPRAISGVGDEAYWVGGPITGALYVLRGNTFIRVSVGGVREEPARIEKSITLARAALKRL